MQALWKPKLFPQKHSESPKSDISSLLVGLTTLDLGCHQSINLADRTQPTETDSDNLDSSP